jgi:hypothetical protein
VATSIPLPSTAFDSATLRLSQNFHERLGVNKTVLTVPVRKPAQQALQPLEQAGLVTVAKTPGRNPRMSVLKRPE